MLVGRPFVKGQSGNPSGRTKRDRKIAVLARSHGPDAIRRLAEIMLTSKDERAVIAAAQVLLERGYGKPRQDVTLSGDEDGPPIKLQGLGPIYGLQPPAET